MNFSIPMLMISTAFFIPFSAEARKYLTFDICGKFDQKAETIRLNEIEDHLQLTSTSKDGRVKNFKIDFTKLIENDLHQINLIVFNGILISLEISKFGSLNNSTKLSRAVIQQYGKPAFDKFEPVIGDSYSAKFKFNNPDTNVNVYAWITPVKKSTIENYGFIPDALDSVDYVCAKEFSDYEKYLNQNKKPVVRPNVIF